MTDLSNKSCAPCDGNLPPLSKPMAQALQLQVPDWSLSKDGTSIQRRWTFKGFKKALAAVNVVGEVANEQRHHPDVAFGFGYMTVALTTHAIGGLSENDFIVARHIDRAIGAQS